MTSMGRGQGRSQRGSGGARAARGAVLGGLWVMAAAGCSEHRMRLDRFLEAQKEAAERAAQPASHAGLAEQVDRVLRPYEVGPHDLLQVIILGNKGEPLFTPLQVRVTQNGNVIVPLVGQVSVGGKNLEEVEAALHDAFVPAYATAAVAHVDVVLPHVASVLVVGATTVPGLTLLQRHQRNVLHAIAAAGGVSELASGRATLQRLRDPNAIETFDLTDPADLSRALALDPLQDGDIITVQAAEPSLIFVGGLVNFPAVQAIPVGTSRNVLQALAAAGGLRTDVTPQEATLVRRLTDGTDVQVKLPLDEIATGKSPNLELYAGDILWIPETFGTKLQEFANRNFYLRAGAAVTYNVSGVEYLNRASQQNNTARGNLEQQFDPFGFLQRGAALQSIQRLGP